MDTMRTILSITMHKICYVYQMDVKYAFLNGYLEEEVYVEQPQVYDVIGKEEKAYIIKNHSMD